METEGVPLDTRFFCLFKGDPGCGKSIAAASYPGHRERKNIGPYFFDIDKRIKSVINYWRPRGREFIYDHYQNFYQIQQKLEEFTVYCPFETLVFDGITMGGKLILRTMIDTRDSGSKRVIRGGIELNQIEDYGGEGKGLDKIIEMLQVISVRQSVNVIVTAHILETSSTDIKTKVTTVSRSLLTGGKKVAASLPVCFDEAYHFDVQPSFDPNEMPKHTIVTHNVGDDWAKTALPLPMRLDFTNQSLYDVIMRELEGKEFVRPVNKLEEPIEPFSLTLGDGSKAF